MPILAEIIWSAITAILAAMLAFVPMTNILGYELAEVLCLVSLVLVPWIAFRRLNQGVVNILRDGVGRTALALVLRCGLPLLPPPVVMVLNSLRVPNCDMLTGIALYLLLPVCSMALLVGTTMVIWCVFRRPWVQKLVYVLILLFGAAASTLHILLHPPIWAFHPFVGYVAGSIYDEALTIPDGLIAYRLMCLAFLVVMLSGLELGKRRRQGQHWATVAVVMVLAGLAWLGVYSQRFELRIEATREAIIEALGGEIRSEHFVIYYPENDLTIRRSLQAMVDDHEYRYFRHSQFFGVEPDGPVSVFVYSSAEQKARYMGAARTLIARPWLAEIHIFWSSVGEGAMTHELAHVFSARLGSGPLELGGGGLHMDMGLVEGIAEAAAWDGDELTFHGWAAALGRLGLAPDLTEIIGATGFWSQYSRTAYTLMGSFSRWLIDEYGMEAYGNLYATGDFMLAYQVEGSELVARWEAFLDGLPLTPDQLEVARFRYDRPPIFDKRCARSLGASADEGRDMAAQARYDDAVECFAGIVRDDPQNPDYRLEYARYLRQAGLNQQARDEILALLARSDMDRIHVAYGNELLGDIAWSENDLAGAAALYQLVLTEPLPEVDRRRITVKNWAVGQPGTADVVYQYMLSAPAPTGEALVASLLSTYQATNDLGIAYLLGVRLFSVQSYELALPLLDSSVRRLTAPGAPDDPGARAIRWNAELRAAQAVFLLGRHEEALERFERLAAQGGSPVIDAHAELAQDWVERSRWMLSGAE